MSPADAVPYIDLEKAKYPEIEKLPFNSKNKFMATINEVDGERVLFIKVRKTPSWPGSWANCSLL